MSDEDGRTIKMMQKTEREKLMIKSKNSTPRLLKRNKNRNNSLPTEKTAADCLLNKIEQFNKKERKQTNLASQKR